jgi:hypothetical protein
MRRIKIAAAAAAAALLLSACGTAFAGGSGDTPDNDTPDNGSVVDPDDGDAGDEFPTDQAREEARGYLGMDEGDLPEEVRISRRGDETFMLTEDYVLGRATVELDDLDGDGFRVVSVTVELPDGPETFELEAN